jgi:hypothetical protein
MKVLLLSAMILSSTLVACGGGGSSTTDAAQVADAAVDANSNVGDLPVPTTGFQIFTPYVQIKAGQEITYRYFTHFKGAAEVGVKRWQSKMTPGSHHVIMYFTKNSLGADGTIEPGSCNGNGNNPTQVPVWTYSAQSVDAEAPMPAGVGMTVPANQKMCIEMHYLNASDRDLQARSTINGETYAAGQAYQKAAAFITYNVDISIPPNKSASASDSCPVDPAAKFFLLSTHAHKQAKLTTIKNGSATVFQSDNWEHPGGAAFTAPFFTFSSGKLDIQCDYVNPTNNLIMTGPSAQTDEMCMAVGYYFPSTGTRFCTRGLTTTL